MGSRFALSSCPRSKNAGQSRMYGKRLSGASTDVPDTFTQAEPLTDPEFDCLGNFRKRRDHLMNLEQPDGFSGCSGRRSTADAECR